MKLGRRPGAFVAFVDTSTEETLLKVECSPADVDLIAFRLYDCQGRLVSDSGGPQELKGGLEVRDGAGELLLRVAPSRGESVVYRLYSSRGSLLTSSDGQRTQIFGGVRMEGNKHLAGRPPATAAVSKAPSEGIHVG